ncbi:ryanodine receptor 1-like [Pluvialis apricaria]
MSQCGLPCGGLTGRPRYTTANWYKPAPLDLAHVKLTPAQLTLVDRLAENGCNVWARDHVQQGWTYSPLQDIKPKRNLWLVPYHLLDEHTKRTNQESLCQALGGSRHPRRQGSPCFTPPHPVSPQNIMPISAAMFSSEQKNPEPQCPPWLVTQHLTPITSSCMPNEFLAMESTRLSERHSWVVECNEPFIMMALHIPEENRCIDIMELSEQLDLLRLQWHTLKLYCAVCALGNNRVAHVLCRHVDQAQLLFAIESPELPGLLHAGYYDLLLAMHLDAAQCACASMSAEYIIPMTKATKSISLFPAGGRAPGPPSIGPSACLRPQLHFAKPCFILVAGGGWVPLALGIPLGALGARAIRMLAEEVAGGGLHAWDPVGDSVEFQLVPVLKLVSALLAVGALGDADMQRILCMIKPRVFGEPWQDPSGDGEEEEEEARRKAIEVGKMEEEEEEEEEEEGLEEGLLQMKLPESVKLQMYNLLQYFCERELQHRVEAIAAFSEWHVEWLQRDQQRRYGQLTWVLTMSAAETTRLTPPGAVLKIEDLKETDCSQ